MNNNKDYPFPVKAVAIAALQVSARWIRNAVLCTLVVALLSVAACSASTIISYINQGLQIALEFLPLAVPGLPPAVTTYFTSGLACVQVAADEVATMDSNAVKSAKITAQCAALVQANLPPGTPQNIVNLASKLATKIADILSHLPATSPTALAAGKPVYMHLSKGDVAKLHSIAKQASEAKAKLAKK